MRRFLSALLAMVMVVTMIPALGLSDGEIPEEPVVVEEPAAVEEAEPEPEPVPEPVKEEKPEPAKEEKKEAPAKEEKKEEPAKVEKQEEPAQEEPAAEPETPAAEPETPAAEPETPVEEPETPAEEPETPAEEPETPAEEPEQPAEEPETPAEEPEQPAAEPETPAAEPETPAEEPEQPEEEPAEEEVKFSRGYALAAKDTKLYTNQYLGTLLGTLDEDTVIYATELSDDETALAILLAVEGEAKEAWLHAEDVTPLTEEETAAYEQETADVDQNGILLKNAAFTPKEAEEPEISEEEAEEKATASTLQDVTAAYQSADKTITIVLTSQALPAGGYKITDQLIAPTPGDAKTVAAKYITVKNSGKTKTTLTIKGLKAGNRHELVITPLNSKGKWDKKGSVVKVQAEIVDWTFRTEQPALKNPEQEAVGHVSLSWTGSTPAVGGGWYVLVDGQTAEGAAVADGGDGAWSAELDVDNGDHTFAVQPYFKATSAVVIDDEVKPSLEKTIKGKSSKALNYTVDDNYAVKWYKPVEITSAKQTKAQTVVIEFTAERPADTYKVYISTKPDSGYKLYSKYKGVTAKVALSGNNGTATISGLAEPSSNVKYYYFLFMPYKNGMAGNKDQAGNTIYHTRVWAQVFKWSAVTAMVPTVKVSQTADRTVKMTVTNKMALVGYEILPYVDKKLVKAEADEAGNQIWWGKDESKSTSIILKDIDNGSRSFYARVRMRSFWAVRTAEDREWEWNGVGTTLKAISKVSKTVKLTVADFWSQKPSSLRGAQTAAQGVEIRFNVKALPVADENIGTLGGYFTVTDVTNSKKKVTVLTVNAEDLVYQQNSATSYTVTLTLPKQAAGKHIYQIRAFNKDSDGKRLNGTAVNLTFTVQALKNFMKSVPNLFSVKQTADGEVTLMWEPVTSKIKASRYQIWEYDTSKKAVKGKALATVTESAEAQETDEATGRKYYIATIRSSAAEGKSGTKHVYVVIPQLKSGSKYTNGKMSNPADGTITVYKPEWMPLAEENVEIDRIGTDRTLTFRVKDVKVPVDQYIAKGENGENTVGPQTVAYDKDSGAAEFRFENLAEGQWTFTVTACNAAGTEGRSFTLDESKTLVEAPHLMEPAGLTATVTDLGTLQVDWTAAAEFPEGAEGSFYLWLDGEWIGNIPAQSGNLNYTQTLPGLTAGVHKIKVVPMLNAANPDAETIEGVAAVCESDPVFVSSMILATDRIAIQPNGEDTVTYTWDGEKIPADELIFKAEKGETVTFADTEEGGSLTVKIAEDAGDVVISHKNGWMEPVTLQVEAIHMPTYTLSLTNETEEIFDDEEVKVQLTMEGTMPDGAVEAEKIKYLMVKEDGDELLAEVNSKEWAGILDAGDYKLIAEVTVSYLGTQFPLRSNELAVTVTAVVLEDGDLRYQIIRKGDYEVDDYIGQLKLLGFVEDKSNASPVVKAVNGRNVAIIGMGAFKDNEDLTSITLPNSVAIIEKQAFMNCKNLATMTTTD